MSNVWTWPPSANPPPTAAQTATVFYANPGQITLAVPPVVLGSTPGALDAEFESDPGWIYSEFVPSVTTRPFAGVPNWDVRIAGPNPAIAFDQRKSFVTLQQPGSVPVDGAYTPATPVTFVPNVGKWYWCGGGVGYEFERDVRRGLAVFANASGAPSRQNFVYLGNFDPGGSYSMMSAMQIAANVATAVNGTPGGTGRPTGSGWPYLALYQRPAGTPAGISYDAWVFNDMGERCLIGTIPAGAIIGATYFVGFYMRQISAEPSTGWQNIFQADFFRELTGPTPPWAR